jgi:hypothetical protein
MVLFFHQQALCLPYHRSENSDHCGFTYFDINPFFDESTGALQVPIDRQTNRSSASRCSVFLFPLTE